MQDKCSAQGYNSSRVNRLAQTDDLPDTGFTFLTTLNVPTKQTHFPRLLQYLDGFLLLNNINITIFAITVDQTKPNSFKHIKHQSL